MPGESSHSPSRSRITAGELVIVCSHYDLGVIEEVRRFRGGSRLAPKVLIKTQWGEFLLKRRAPGVANEPSKVAFTHEVITHLASAGFPSPPPLETRGNKLTMLQLAPSSAGGAGGGGVYEVFRFVQGERYDRTPMSAWAAGWWLARCHAILSDFKPLFPAPRRTFHNHAHVPDRLLSISGVLSDPGVRPVCRALADAYLAAAARVEQIVGVGGGAEESPTQIVHGDWHPGNMLFRVADADGGETAEGAREGVPREAMRVAAVLDFDSARLGQPLHDFANGAMQFSVHRHFGEGGSEGEAGPWRIALDPELFAAFSQGYAAGGGRLGGMAPAVPWLMIEALIVEAGVPIASTGQFGKLNAKPVLGVVFKAAEAMGAQADRLSGLVRGTDV